MTQPSEIALVLSGGSTNLSPNLSLGGDPSAVRVRSGSINNLFSDITADQALAGKTDYRCLYLFNDSHSYVYNINLWVKSEVESGSDIQVGIQAQDEFQRITISNGTPTAGYFTISYLGHTVTSNYNTDLGTWAAALQSDLRTMTDSDNRLLLEDVVVLAQAVDDVILFDIQFAGENGSRNHDEIVVEDNQLTPSVDVAVSVVQNGSPVNTIAPQLDIETTTPGGVSFYLPTEDAPISIPNLGPSEGFPIWFMRTTPANAESVESDGFVLRVKMQSLHP